MATSGAVLGALYYGALAAGAVGGVVQGVEQNRGARSARRRQGQAQDQAEARAASQQRQAQQAEARANRQQPDLAAILAGAQGAGGAGVGGTLLSGAGGVANNSLQLGRTTRLGE